MADNKLPPTVGSDFAGEPVPSTFGDSLPGAEHAEGSWFRPVRPAGSIFIESAVQQIKERLSVPEGPAVKLLLEAIQFNTIRTWMLRPIEFKSLLADQWADAHVYRGAIQSGDLDRIRFQGNRFHLHHIVIAGDDFKFWLDKERPPDSHLCSEPSTATRLPPGSNWMPLREALEYVKAKEGAAGWSMMKRAISLGELPVIGEMKGKPDNMLPPGWALFFARFLDEPRALPVRRDGTMAASVTEADYADEPTGDDFLFDLRKATEHRVHMPSHRMTNVVVERAALMRLWPDEATVAQPAANPAALKTATDAVTYATIEAIYDHADKCKMKPPNVKELPGFVNEILSFEGRKAPRGYLDKAAAEFANRRRKPGARVNSSLPAFSLEGWQKSGMES